MTAATHRRQGSRPTVSTTGPQRQLDQRSPPAIWGELVSAVFGIPGVIEGHSAVSPASSRAVFVEDVVAPPEPRRSLAPPESRHEPVHIHGVDDTSLHLVLPPVRGRELVDLGWAEPHQYGDWGTEVLVYGPRDHQKLVFVLEVIQESLSWSRVSS